MKTQNKTRPTATFMMGGPASGKTRVRNAMFQGVKVLDCDEIKKTLPGYDPKNPGAVHELSTTLLDRAFFAQVATGETFVYDGTGTNVEKYASLFQIARKAGYTVQVVYVSCNLKLALERNAKRERTVPEHIVREKYATIEFAFEILSTRADEVNVVRN